MGLDLNAPLRLYAALRGRMLDRQDPVAAQERTLRKLLRRARETRFGRDHDFASLRTVADFQRAVPLRGYEAFWDEYWSHGFPVLDDVTWPGRIPYFALSSGTTHDVTKYLPLSAKMNRANQFAAADVLVHHLRAHPRSRVFGGKNLILSGSTSMEELAPGIKAGDLSGIAADQIPRWARHLSYPPPDLAFLDDWEEKIKRLAPRALEADIRSINGTPSWLLIFFDTLHDLRPETSGRLVEYFPNLELLVHGGLDFAPYRHRFEMLLEGSHAETREVYAASEGFIAVADRGPGEGMRLLLDIGLFFEFVPVEELDDDNPTRHWVADAELGRNYAIVLSTNAGHWAYVVGDTVELVSKNPPRVLVTGRTAYTLSAFGEHLIGAEIEAAAARAAEDIGVELSDYSVGAVFPQAKGELGGHLWVVEFAEAVSESVAARFGERLDAHLADENADYKAHRAEDYGMAPPRIRRVQPGTFAAWMKKRGRLGGQNKVPRVINDRDLFDDLLAFTADRS